MLSPITHISRCVCLLGFYSVSFALTVFKQLCNTQIEGDILEREKEEQELKEENFGLNWLGAAR